MKNWLARFQEFVGWAPLAFVLAVVAWGFLGGIADRDDLIRRLLQLPVASIYALLASGVAYLVWRRWSYRLGDEQLKAYWEGVMAGNRGPLIVYAVNAGFYLCAFLAVLFFLYFWR